MLKRSSIINLQSVSILKVFSILRCRRNICKKIVGKVAVTAPLYLWLVYVNKGIKQFHISRYRDLEFDLKL